MLLRSSDIISMELSVRYLVIIIVRNSISLKDLKLLKDNYVTIQYYLVKINVVADALS